MQADPNAALARSLGAKLYKPPLRERFVRWIGFSEPVFVDVSAYDGHPSFVAGALHQNFMFKLTLKDRLLILLGGNIAVRNFIKTSHSVESSRTIGAWSVIEPGADFK